MPVALADDRLDMSKQQTAKRKKENILFDQTILDVGEIYIDVLYYNEMFHYAMCWNTAAAVEREMKNLNSKSSNLIDLKENIRMRVIGLGWEDLRTHWSNNGKASTTEEITLHLKILVSKHQSCSIPTKPPVLLPVQKALPQLDTQAPDVVAMDVAFIETTDEFEQQASRTRLEREVVGVCGRYSNMQPTSAPAIDKGLIGKRLDVYLQYFLGDGRTELLWSQGEVILVSYGTKIPKKQGQQACYKSGEAVMIRWDRK